MRETSEERFYNELDKAYGVNSSDFKAADDFNLNDIGETVGALGRVADKVMLIHTVQMLITGLYKPYFT